MALKLISEPIDTPPHPMMVGNGYTHTGNDQWEPFVYVSAPTLVATIIHVLFFFLAYLNI